MSAKIIGFDKVLQDLERINLTDSEAKNILEGAADIALPVMRQNLKSVIGNDSTGQLVSSLGTSPVKLNSKGMHNIKVGFREPRKGEKSNAMVANILEHGSSKQRPRPWFAPSVKKVKKTITDYVVKSIEDKLKG